MRVVYKLLQSSWRDDAVQLDRARGIFTDPALVREVHHKGAFFDVAGPHIVHPTPQRTPVLMQAGTSKAGKAFAAQHAEVIFAWGHSPDAIKKNVADVRQTARDDFGRDPRAIKVLTMVTPVLGRTEDEARAKYEDYRKYASSEGALALFGGWTGMDLDEYGDDQELREVESNSIRSAIEGFARHSPAHYDKWTKHTVAEHVSIGGPGPILVGTPAQVADSLEVWVREADVDGFNFVSRCVSLCVIGAAADPSSRTLLCPPRSTTLASCSSPSCARVVWWMMTTPSPGARTARTCTESRGKSTRPRTMLRPSTTGLLGSPRRTTRFPSRAVCTSQHDIRVVSKYINRVTCTSHLGQQDISWLRVNGVR